MRNLSSLKLILILPCLTLFLCLPAVAERLAEFERPTCEGGVVPFTPTLPFNPQRFMAPATLPVFTSAERKIDLLIAYAPEVLTALGSEDAVLEEVRRIVYYANRAHSNSETGASFSVVHVHALTTNPTDVFSTDLNAATLVDGVWDELFTLRDQYKADMVSVLVNGTQGGTLCGLAWINGIGLTFAQGLDFMFSVVSVNRICTHDTLVHELGHNMGSNHDRPDASGGASQSFSYGYRFTGDSKQVWHTVMAIPPDRAIPYFSSPLLAYDGKTIGIEGSEDNVTSLILAAADIEGLFTSLNGSDLALPAPSQPDKITVKFKRVSNGKRIEVRTKLTSGGVALYYHPVEVYFSRGRGGKKNLRAIGRTNSNGEVVFKERSNIAPGIFYRSCFPGSSATFLCSKPFEIAKTK